MLRLRITYFEVRELRRTLDDEVGRGALLVRVTPPEDVEFRARVALELASPAGTLEVETEVMSLLPGVGIAVAFPGERADEVRALLEAMEDGDGEGGATHEVVVPSEVATEPASEVSSDVPGEVASDVPSDAPGEVASDVPSEAPSAPTRVRKNPVAEKIRLALHGTRDDRATLLRDRDRSLHAIVLKSPKVTIDEVAAWARNPQMGAEFLKQIGDRKDWLSRPAIAQALTRNPKTPPDLAVRALDHIGLEALKQAARGAGVPPYVAQAARKKVTGK